jgi:hypothetical protein
MKALKTTLMGALTAAAIGAGGFAWSQASPQTPPNAPQAGGHMQQHDKRHAEMQARHAEHKQGAAHAHGAKPAQQKHRHGEPHGEGH